MIFGIKLKKQENLFFSCLMIFLGSILVTLTIHIFLEPNKLIDGGIIGVSMILNSLFKSDLFSMLYLITTIPFIYFAFINIGRTFIWKFIFAVTCLFITTLMFNFLYSSNDIHLLVEKLALQPIEYISLSGVVLGFGVGLIIRYGACLDGTEIIAIHINKNYGISVGSIILAFNCLIFLVAGKIFGVHSAWQSLLVYIIAYKIIDIVIAGFDEMKSVSIFSDSKTMVQEIFNQLRVGATVIKAKGGYKNDDKEIIYVVIERLQISELKKIVHKTDPKAWMIIENVHEIVLPRK